MGAESFKQAVRAAAAGRLGCEPGAVELIEGRIAAAPDGQSVTLTELARHLLRLHRDQSGGSGCGQWHHDQTGAVKAAITAGLGRY
jgi:hypothetical protein